MPRAHHIVQFQLPIPVSKTSSKSKGGSRKKKGVARAVQRASAVSARLLRDFSPSFFSGSQGADPSTEPPAPPLNIPGPSSKPAELCSSIAGRTPAMFGHPSAPDLSECVRAVGVAAHLTMDPLSLSDGLCVQGTRDPCAASWTDRLADVSYWKERAEFALHKSEHFERKCGELGVQLGFTTHALEGHIRSSKLASASLNDRLTLALEENTRLSSLLETAMEKSRDYDTLLEERRELQAKLAAVTETLDGYVKRDSEVLGDFEHGVFGGYPCDWYGL